jgi:hypothetical protein
MEITIECVHVDDSLRLMHIRGIKRWTFDFEIAGIEVRLRFWLRLSFDLPMRDVRVSKQMTSSPPRAPLKKLVVKLVRVFGRRVCRAVSLNEEPAEFLGL